MTHLMTGTLRLTKNNKLFIPTRAVNGDFDNITLHFEVEGSSWNSGVITVKKANTDNMAAVDTSTPATTISADGFTTLTGGDWYGAALIVLDVTTEASPNTTKVRYAINRARIGVFDASPP